MSKLNIYHYFLYKLNYLYRALLLMPLLMVFYLFIKENGKKTKEKIVCLFKHGWEIGFFFYLALLLTSTIFARKVENPYQNIWGHFGFRDDLEWNFEVVMNILLFVPYTYLFIKAFNPILPWKSSLILSLITTVFVEFSQLLFWLGDFQLSDMLHNIIGGMIGFGLNRLINWIKGRCLFQNQ